jgi:DNA-directed RNA polymerase
MDKILRMDQSFIKKAEEKFLFASFCLILRQLFKNPKIKIHIPIFLDATCSGIQHLAALIQDYELGSRVNLIPQSDNEDVGDIYSDLIKPINTAINKFGKNNSEYIDLQEVKLDRSILKQSIMTKVYNVTYYGIANQLESKLTKTIETIKNETSNFKKVRYKVPNIHGEFTLLSKSDLFIIAKIINEQIFIAFPPLQNIYNYFIEITKILVKIGIQVV